MISYLKKLTKSILDLFGYELRTKTKPVLDVSNIVESQVSKSIVIPKSTTIQYSSLSGKVSIGKRSLIHKVLLDGNIIVGDNTTINGPGTAIYAIKNKIIIGKFCSIARHTAIQGHNHNLNSATTYFIKKHIFNENIGEDEISKGDIVIGNDVWIGTQSVILPTVNIGNGAVVAANSVVNKDVPPFAIVGGSPAKILKYRFSDDIILELLKINWWDWDIDKIKRNKQLFYGELNLEKLKNIVE